MTELDFSQCKTPEDVRKIFAEKEKELALAKKIWLPGEEQ